MKRSVLVGLGVCSLLGALAAGEKAKGTFTISERRFIGRVLTLPEEMQAWLTKMRTEAARLKSSTSPRKQDAFWNRAAYPAEGIRNLATEARTAITNCTSKRQDIAKLKKLFLNVIKEAERPTIQCWEKSGSYRSDIAKAVAAIRESRKRLGKAWDECQDAASKLKEAYLAERHEHEAAIYPQVPPRKQPNVRRTDWTQQELDYGESIDRFYRGLSRYERRIALLWRRYDDGEIRKVHLLHEACPSAHKLDDAKVYSFVEQPPSPRLRKVHDVLMQYVRASKQLADLLPKDQTFLAAEGFDLDEDAVRKAYEKCEYHRRQFCSELYAIE